MKNIVLSAVAVLAMSTFAVAGGDVAPIEEPVIVEEVVVPDAGFYLGLAYGWQGLEVYNDMYTDVDTLDIDFGSVMVNAGYKFNSYIAVEGRYWFGLSSDDLLAWQNDLPADMTVDSWGIFIKPMYPVSDTFNIYALIGYASTDVTFDLPAGYSLETDSADAFAWGLGASYAFTENISMFVDYTQLLNNEDVAAGNEVIDFTLDTVNIGVNYRF